jgi:FixJ family two-component response regulator
MSSSVYVHIVDDDNAVRESLGDLLRSMGYEAMLYLRVSQGRIA